MKKDTTYAIEDNDTTLTICIENLTDAEADILIEEIQKIAEKHGVTITENYRVPMAESEQHKPTL